MSILQESKLPVAFLESVNRQFPISPEVLTAIPNAFGAICLNQQGLDDYLARAPMKNYLLTMISKEEFIYLLAENDVSILIGNSVDEFMRHHPTTKEGVFDAIHGMLETTIAVMKEGGLPRFEEKKEMAMYVDVMSRVCLLYTLIPSLIFLVHRRPVPESSAWQRFRETSLHEIIHRDDVHANPSLRFRLQFVFIFRFECVPWIV